MEQFLTQLTTPETNENSSSLEPIKSYRSKQIKFFEIRNELREINFSEIFDQFSEVQQNLIELYKEYYEKQSKITTNDFRIKLNSLIAQSKSLNLEFSVYSKKNTNIEILEPFKAKRDVYISNIKSIQKSFQKYKPNKSSLPLEFILKDIDSLQEYSIIFENKENLISREYHQRVEDLLGQIDYLLSYVSESRFSFIERINNARSEISHIQNENRITDPELKNSIEVLYSKLSNASDNSKPLSKRDSLRQLRIQQNRLYKQNNFDQN